MVYTKCVNVIDIKSYYQMNCVYNTTSIGFVSTNVKTKNDSYSTRNNEYVSKANVVTTMDLNSTILWHSLRMPFFVVKTTICF